MRLEEAPFAYPNRFKGIQSEPQVNEKIQDFRTLRAVYGSPQTATWRLHRWNAFLVSTCLLLSQRDPNGNLRLQEMSVFHQLRLLLSGPFELQHR